ncbi:MAG: DUF308 domain-containing protein [Bacteroides sp.]
MKTVFDKIDYAVQNWWMSLFLGFLFIGVALSLMFAPLSSYIALSVIFSICLLISGILEIMFASSNRKTISSWGWYLAAGIIDLLIGIYLVVYPTLSMEIIPFIVAFWLMFRGFTGLGYAMDLRRYGTREWGWYLAFGILAILCSLAIIWQPGIGVFSVIYMLAFTFLIIGCFKVMISFEFKKLHKKEQQFDETARKN